MSEKRAVFWVYDQDKDLLDGDQVKKIDDFVEARPDLVWRMPELGKYGLKINAPEEIFSTLQDFISKIKKGHFIEIENDADYGQCIVKYLFKSLNSNKPTANQNVELMKDDLVYDWKLKMRTEKLSQSDLENIATNQVCYANIKTQIKDLISELESLNAPPEIRRHSNQSKAIIREKDNGNWTVDILFSPGTAVMGFTKSGNQEAKAFADNKLSNNHICSSQCGNWEILADDDLEILEFGPLTNN